MFIPQWLSELFPEQYLQFDAQGHRNVIFVKGNMPGKTGCRKDMASRLR